MSLQAARKETRDKGTKVEGAGRGESNFTLTLDSPYSQQLNFHTLKMLTKTSKMSKMSKEGAQKKKEQRTKNQERKKERKKKLSSIESKGNIKMGG